MRENVSLLLNRAEDLMPKDVENAKALNALFTLVFTGKICLQKFQTLEINGEVRSKRSSWGTFKQNWTYASHWDLMGYTQKCSGSWLMSL